MSDPNLNLPPRPPRTSSSSSSSSSSTTKPPVTRRLEQTEISSISHAWAHVGVATVALQMASTYLARICHGVPVGDLRPRLDAVGRLAKDLRRVSRGFEGKVESEGGDSGGVLENFEAGSHWNLEDDLPDWWPRQSEDGGLEEKDEQKDGEKDGEKGGEKDGEKAGEKDDENYDEKDDEKDDGKDDEKDENRLPDETLEENETMQSTANGGAVRWEHYLGADTDASVKLGSILSGPGVIVKPTEESSLVEGENASQGTGLTANPMERERVSLQALNVEQDDVGEGSTKLGCADDGGAALGQGKNAKKNRKKRERLRAKKQRTAQGAWAV